MEYAKSAPAGFEATRQSKPVSTSKPDQPRSKGILTSGKLFVHRSPLFQSATAPGKRARFATVDSNYDEAESRRQRIDEIRRATEDYPNHYEHTQDIAQVDQQPQNGNEQEKELRTEKPLSQWKTDAIKHVMEASEELENEIEWLRLHNPTVDGYIEPVQDIAQLNKQPQNRHEHTSKVHLPEHQGDAINGVLKGQEEHVDHAQHDYRLQVVQPQIDDLERVVVARKKLTEDNEHRRLLRLAQPAPEVQKEPNENRRQTRFAWGVLEDQEYDFGMGEAYREDQAIKAAANAKVNEWLNGIVLVSVGYGDVEVSVQRDPEVIQMSSDSEDEVEDLVRGGKSVQLPIEMEMSDAEAEQGSDPGDQEESDSENEEKTPHKCNVPGKSFLPGLMACSHPHHNGVEYLKQKDARDANESDSDDEEEMEGKDTFMAGLFASDSYMRQRYLKEQKQKRRRR